MMKTVIKTGDIVLGEVTVKGIEVEQHYDACDAIKLVGYGKQFVKELTEEMPEMLKNLKPVVEEFMEEIDRDTRASRKEVFNDRKNLMYMRVKLDEAEEQINSCNGEFDQTTVDVAYGMLDKVEEMYFDLYCTTATDIEERILELTERIERLK